MVPNTRGMSSHHRLHSDRGHKQGDGAPNGVSNIDDDRPRTGRYDWTDELRVDLLHFYESSIPDRREYVTRYVWGYISLSQIQRN